MINKRNIYINNMDVDKAKSLYYAKVNLQGTFEKIHVLDSLNRITYEPIHAITSSPHYNSAAMDGISVNSKITIGASESSPKILELGKDFVYINTGNPISKEHDAVIMIEDIIDLGNNKVQILSAAHPWQHIRPVGEDIVGTEMIVPSKHKIRPIDIGALIAGGIEELRVYKRPLVGILPTGTEITDSIGPQEAGKISDSNSRVFEGLIYNMGAIPNRYSPIPDDYRLLKEKIAAAVKENDLLIINAGSSAGSKDWTSNIIEELGEVFVHGVALKPGKPTILGLIDNKPVVGIPGYPVSSYFVFDTFVKPLILKLLGQDNLQPETVSAILTKTITSSFKNEHLVRMNLGLIQDKLIAVPISGGAGVTMSLVRADGILRIPRNVEGIEAGEIVEIELLKPISHIKNSLISIGSHDLILDIIGDMIDLTSSHVGSMGGITSMLKRECNISPIHLLDENTGHYNVDYVKKYFPNKEMALIKGVQRIQGFLVPKGNPKNIQSFKDLTRDDIVFVNRQRGAGTRILLDYYLKKLDIDPKSIQGYNRQMNTHMAVGTAVLTGGADVGLGIYSAAKALDLDFIEVAYEDYDFLVEYESLQEARVKEFIDVLKSKEFKSKVSRLGGYNFKNTGHIITI